MFNQESSRDNSVTPYAFGYSVNDGVGNRQFHDEFGDKNGDKIGSYGYMDKNGMYRKVNYVADGNGFKVKVHSNEMPPLPHLKEGTIKTKIVGSPMSLSSTHSYIHPYEPVVSESNEDSINIYESRRGQIKPLTERNEEVLDNRKKYLFNYASYPVTNYVTTKKPSRHGSALFGSYYKSLRDKSHEDGQRRDVVGQGSGKEEFDADFSTKFKRVPKYQMPSDQNNQNNVNTVIIASNSPYITEGLRKSNNYHEDPSVKPYLPRAIKMVKLKSYKKVDTRGLQSIPSVRHINSQISPTSPSPTFFQSQYHQQQQLRHQQPRDAGPKTFYGVTIDHGHLHVDQNHTLNYPKSSGSPYFDDTDWLRSLPTTTTTPVPKIDSHLTWYKPHTDTNFKAPIVRRPSNHVNSHAPVQTSARTAEDDASSRFLSDNALFEKRSKFDQTDHNRDNLNTIESSNELIKNEMEGKYFGHVPFGARLSNAAKSGSNDSKKKDLERFYSHYESTRNPSIGSVPNAGLGRKEDEIIHLTYNKMTPKVHYDLEREALFGHRSKNENVDDNSVIDDTVISKRIDEVNDSNESTSTTTDAVPVERKKFSYEPPISSKDTILDKWSARIWPPPSKKS